MQQLEHLYHKIGYQFQNRQLLITALSHRSAGRNSNERLEFLGDSILNFVIADYLYKTYPNLKEGELSRLRASLVKGETLAKIGQEFELQYFLRLGAGELKSGGAHRASIHADAIEAMIGAIFTDADFATCQERILAWFASRLANINLRSETKDAKTQLQEYLQSHKYSLPEYSVEDITGQAHEQVFHVKCVVTKLPYESTGVGSSRRKAEQRAAKAYLQLLRR